MTKDLLEMTKDLLEMTKGTAPLEMTKGDGFARNDKGLVISTKVRRTAWRDLQIE